MKRLLVFIILPTILILTSCSINKDKSDKSKNEYQIYCIDSKSSGIVSESYIPKGSSRKELVSEIMEVLQKEPKNVTYKRGIPEGVSILDYKIDNDQLIINFDSKYGELKGIQEILCRATIVKTMCQIRV